MHAEQIAMGFQEMGETEAAPPALDISSAWEFCAAENGGDVLTPLTETLQPSPSDLPALVRA